MMKTACPSSRPIIIVEDVDSDFEIVRRGFQRHGVPAPFIRLASLEEAATFFYQRPSAPEPPADKPAVIILDLRLVDGDGQEILTQLKRDDHLKEIPVIVWSASSDPSAVDLCYRAGANSYLRKASDPAVTDHNIECFVNYWLQTVELPSSSRN